MTSKTIETKPDITPAASATNAGEDKPKTNPYHKKVTLFPTPTGHHHQKKERTTLPESGTTGVEGADLTKNVEVYSAAGDELFTIPRADIISLPHGTQPNDICKKLHLCPYFDHKQGTGSCPHSQEPEGCKHIHASLANATKHDIHINYLWKTLEGVKYERFPPGQTFNVAPPNETVLLDVIPSELVIKTKAFEGHNSTGKRTVAHCAHYYFNRVCNRGTRCFFVHAVSFTPFPPKASDEHTHNNSNNSKCKSCITEAASCADETGDKKEERKSYGRTQHLREFPTFAAAQKTVRDAALERKKRAVSGSASSTPPNGTTTPAPADAHRRKDAAKLPRDFVFSENEIDKNKTAVPSMTTTTTTPALLAPFPPTAPLTQPASTPLVTATPPYRFPTSSSSTRGATTSNVGASTNNSNSENKNGNKNALEHHDGALDEEDDDRDSYHSDSSSFAERSVCSDASAEECKLLTLTVGESSNPVMMSTVNHNHQNNSSPSTSDRAEEQPKFQQQQFSHDRIQRPAYNNNNYDNFNHTHAQQRHNNNNQMYYQQQWNSNNSAYNGFYRQQHQQYNHVAPNYYYHKNYTPMTTMTSMNSFSSIRSPSQQYHHHHPHHQQQQQHRRFSPFGSAVFADSSSSASRSWGSSSNSNNSSSYLRPQMTNDADDDGKRLFMMHNPYSMTSNRVFFRA